MKYTLIGLAVVIIAGAGYFAFRGNSSDVSMMDQDDKMMSQETAMDSSNEMMDSDSMMSSQDEFSGSIFDLAKRGGDYKCTFSTDNVTSKSTGVVYVSGDKVRGDFQSVVKQVSMTVDSHMILDKGYVYTWSPIAPNGFKAKATAEGQGGIQTSGQGFDANGQYKYDCQKTKVDQSVFNLPAGVNFQTI